MLCFNQTLGFSIGGIAGRKKMLVEYKLGLTPDAWKALPTTDASKHQSAWNVHCVDEDQALTSFDEDPLVVPSVQKD